MEKFDQSFKRALDKKEIPYSDQYWSSMELMIEKDKRKKGFLWYRYGALVLVLTGIVAGIYQFQNQPQTVQSRKMVQLDVLQDKTSTLSNADENSLTKLSNNTNQFGQLKQLSKTPIEIEENPENIQAEANNESAKNTINIESLTLGLNNSDTKSVNNNPIFDEVNKWLHLRPILHKKQSLVLDQFFEIEKYAEGLKRITTDSVKKRKQNVSSDFHFSILPFLSNNSLKVLNDESVDKEYKYNSHMSNPFNGGLHLKFSKGMFSIMTGFQYSTMRETADYAKFAKWDFDTTRKIILDYNFRLSALGNSVYRVDDLVDTSRYELYKYTEQEKAEWTYLGVPVAIQLNRNYKKLNVFLEAGLLTQFVVNYSGRYLDIHQETKTITYNGLNKVVYNAQYGLGLSYPIYKSINVFGSYNSTRNLTSMMKFYDHKVSINRINFGLEFKLK